MGFVLFALVVLALNRSSPSSAPDGASAAVYFRERANGVHPDLQGLLDAWQLEGTFDIAIGGGSGFPNGGLRSSDEVEAAAAQGLSNATDLSQTPHGRGAALDVWPAEFSPFQSFDEQPGTQDKMQQFGEWAESKGFVWGGRFPGHYGASATVTGDWPHVELANWRALPYPPPDYGGAA